jgi:hypothetical protein
MHCLGAHFFAYVSGAVIADVIVAQMKPSIALRLKAHVTDHHDLWTSVHAALFHNFPNQCGINSSAAHCYAQHCVVTAP